MTKTTHLPLSLALTPFAKLHQSEVEFFLLYFYNLILKVSPSSY
jgi:hypothetical protein